MVSPSPWKSAFPPETGLYSPSLERDSCGVGFLVNISGKPSHQILNQARDLLANLAHRGAVGSHKNDGDGAGVMTFIPDKFFREEAKRLGFNELRPAGQYAVGNLFMTPEEAKRKKEMQFFEDLAREYGLKVIGWRNVPKDNSILGPTTLRREPVILQPFIVIDLEEMVVGHSGSRQNEAEEEFNQEFFERQLYVFRKHATNRIHRLFPDDDYFYICSLSSRNIVYKGQFTCSQVWSYYYDLNSVDYETHFALVHSRFSTNTFPSWERAQPLRLCAHNGEVNTLRGNKNWMRAREGVLHSKKFHKDLEKLYPIIEKNGSDSAAFDNVLELLVINGVLTLPEAVMIMVPEAWQNNPHMSQEKRDFYKWASCIMEPWDGPALFTFSDGRYCGASLDRNGLRPCRYYVTEDGMMICASEVGCLRIDSERIKYKGRLQPGKMLLVDTQKGHIVEDEDLKLLVAKKAPFGEWIREEMINLEDVITRARRMGEGRAWWEGGGGWEGVKAVNDKRLKAFGYSLEHLNMLLLPMIRDGKEALGSMGNDAILACLSQKPRIIYDYFRQLFAQVTNPPIDPIRESIVMSLECCIGPEGNMLDIDSSQCHRLMLKSPVLSLVEMECIKNMQKYVSTWPVIIIDITFEKILGTKGYMDTLEKVCAQVSRAILEGCKIVILSDRGINENRACVSALVALGTVHQYLVQNKHRSKVALIVETGEAREIHHLCVLIGYGADAVCPYLVMELIFKLKLEGEISDPLRGEKALENYIKACDNGILKVMSKMGISTLQSYKGAQIFEALGICEEVIERCFYGTPSRIGGADFELLAKDSLDFHSQAWPARESTIPDVLADPGEYHWRDQGEHHINHPQQIAKLQDAVRRKNDNAYKSYSENATKQIQSCTLRGLLEFNYTTAKPVAIEEVEPWTSIVKKFCTGAMSYGSISYEAHTTLAAAMNRLGGKSNTGEGGEDPERSVLREDGDWHRSAIKQIASGRFGVTSFYVSDADELQIKMAQGAKPGEGGELPGHKVSESIAATRKSTPGVGLISPPPHHDIYSIEDLKQLIYDLKSSNPRARVSVKLVSEVGVGVVASGVAKAKADHILISGHDGGTGAARWTSIKYAGLPWELGLAETHQTLVLNDLRDRVVVQTDGQLRTGRDVAIACLLGAEEWGFATAPLIAMGCTMMRKCHLNTCPVGIATQDPELRAKFTGAPEHVVNFFYYVAEEMRAIMAKLGFRSVREMVGRSDMLVMSQERLSRKTKQLDLRGLLMPAYKMRPGAGTFCNRKQNHNLHSRLDNMLIAESEPALFDGVKVHIPSIQVVNTDRTLGATLSHHVSRKYGEQGLAEDTIRVEMQGSAGQSFGAFLAPGITFVLEGDANDYVGKGLSGGKIVIYPPRTSSFPAEKNVIIGNVCLYGATGGKAFIRGVAAERFCVRNSGALAVVEGVGDHCCEYMTGGRVVVLGKTGRNFAAGMSGGIAYVYDPQRHFAQRCNTEMVRLQSIDAEDSIFLRNTIAEHLEATESSIAKKIMSAFSIDEFTKIMPVDYQKVLEASQHMIKESQKIVDSQQEKARIQMELAHGHIADIEDTVLDKLKGFIKYKRRPEPYRDPKRRTKDWKEIGRRLPEKELYRQAARCMDCGVPFCQSDSGCPISNVIPKWNDLVFKQEWRQALDQLVLTNNFPEFTGRVCPAPCEGSCVLGINEPPVGIKSIECAIIDRGFEEGWIVPRPPTMRTGKRIAIIGSGPAGLACADQLNKAGHYVRVYERNDRIGGLLMYGIPNMKLDKQVVQRRVDLLAAEGIEFIPNVHVGVTVDTQTVYSEHDAVVVTVGATIPRDLNIPNRNLNGIHFAMDFLQSNTQSLLDSGLPGGINAKGKNVIVIGGGDTGCDCIATAVRQGAQSIVNFELMSRPPSIRAADNPWPDFPRVFRIEYGHAEVQAHWGRDPREYSILSTAFVSDGNGNVKGVNAQRIEWVMNEHGKWNMQKVPESEKFYPGELILLALGFTGRESLPFTPNSTGYSSNTQGVFFAGDCRRGQSLVVWAIREGREAALEVDRWLTGKSMLPETGGLVLQK